MAKYTRFPLLPTTAFEGVPKLPDSIPWTLIAPHERQAQANHSQTLERLAERGGLSPRELWAVMHDCYFYDPRPPDDEIAVWLRGLDSPDPMIAIARAWARAEPLLMVQAGALHRVARDARSAAELATRLELTENQARDLRAQAGVP